LKNCKISESKLSELKLSPLGVSDPDVNTGDDTETKSEDDAGAIDGLRSDAEYA
jgi:hypothetical protein